MHLWRLLQSRALFELLFQMCQYRAYPNKNLSIAIHSLLDAEEVIWYCHTTMQSVRTDQLIKLCMLTPRQINLARTQINLPDLVTLQGMFTCLRRLAISKLLWLYRQYLQACMQIQILKVTKAECSNVKQLDIVIMPFL